MAATTSNSLAAIVCACVGLSVLTLVSCSQSCEFPAEVQSHLVGRSKRAWHTGIRDQFTSFTSQLEINGSVFRQVPVETRTGPTPVTRRCQRVVNGNRYLVTEEDSRGRILGYTCLRFVMRSPEVMQIWSAVVSTGMDDSLCSNTSMSLDKWLFVDRTRIGETRVRCPLEGGFTIRVYDKSRQRGVCDAWQGETRMESECSDGDGLVFLFRSQSCVPEDMYMYYTQATHCLAVWTEDQHTFAVLRHDQYHYSWLLRYPSAATDSFSAYLMKDFYAETVHVITETRNYLRLDSTRDTQRTPGDLCYDDYERCTYVKKPCTGGVNPPNAALLCPLTCSVCTQSSPVPCRMRPNWIGKWDADGRANNRSNSVTINGTTMTLHSHHRAQNLQCIQWQGAAMTSDGAADDRIMLVAEYSNGCKPRYTCARIQTPTTSQLNISFGKTVMWPFVQSKEEPLDCRATGFIPRTGIDDNKTWSLAVHARESQHATNCHLPFKTSNVQVYFNNRTSCSGRMAETKGRKAVELSLRGCTPTGVIPNFVFSCVESSRFPPDDDLIMITRTQPDMELYCLVFPFADDTTFHLISGAESCQSAIHRSADLDSLHLLRGTLSGIVHRSTSTLAAPTTTTMSSTRAPEPEATTSPISRSSHSERANGFPTPTLSTESSDLEETLEGRGTVPSTTTLSPLVTEHPVVVGFAAFIFGLIQGVIYLCSCF